MKPQLSRSEGHRAALPIHSVSRLTNLSVDTIRAWEKRYGAVRPARAPGGQRLFSPDDIARLVLLKAAVEAGTSISHLATLGDVELQHVVHAEQRAGESDDAAIAKLLKRTRAMDARGLGHDLCTVALQRSAVEFADDVIAPVMAEITRACSNADELATQHLLICETLRFVSVTLFAKYEQPAATAAMLFLTLPGERHAIPPLLAALVASELGYQGIFAGTEISPRQTVALARSLHAVGIGLFAGAENPDAPRLAGEISAALPSVPLFAGGAGLQKYRAFSTTQSLRDFADVLRRGVKPTAGSSAVATA